MDNFTLVTIAALVILKVIKKYIEVALEVLHSLINNKADQ